jgi:AmmeMemoRadiSam system protein A
MSLGSSDRAFLLGLADRRFLLGLARRAIEARLRGHPGPVARSAEVGSSPEGRTLSEPRGAFVTLRRRDGELRGCVGMVGPEQPLPETVVRAAVAAALSDGRFPPVEAGELSELVLEISVLGPLHPIHPGEVEIGRDGLVIRCEGRQGLLLPQVPNEHGWDRETFLEKICWKAGLPSGTWKRADAELLAFTAEVFTEGDERGEDGTTERGR